jgi:hypothetical protein
MPKTRQSSIFDSRPRRRRRLLTIVFKNPKEQPNHAITQYTKEPLPDLSSFTGKLLIYDSVVDSSSDSKPKEDLETGVEGIVCTALEFCSAVTLTEEENSV